MENKSIKARIAVECTLSKVDTVDTEGYITIEWYDWEVIDGQLEPIGNFERIYLGNPEGICRSHLNQVYNPLQLIRKLKEKIINEQDNFCSSVKRYEIDKIIESCNYWLDKTKAEYTIKTIKDNGTN